MSDRQDAVAASRYEQARRHGLGHKEASRVAASTDPFRCWCGCPTPCVGGARRFVGCAYSVTPAHPEGVHACGEVA